MDERRRLLDEEAELALIDGQLARHKSGPVIGANAQRHQIAFVPSKKNAAFNGGRIRSMEYHYLMRIDAEPDYSALELVFTTCRIVLEGPDLRSLYQRIREHTADTVIEADPLHALHDPLNHPVTALRMEPLKEGD